MIYYIDHVVQVFLLPPGCNLLMGMVAFLIWRHRPNLAKFLIVFSLSSLWLLSTPLVAQKIVNKLQYQFPVLLPEKLSHDKSASAIVVLDAGLNTLTPEYGEPVVSDTTLTRIRYAAFLYRKTGVSILVSGGDPINPSISQADHMAKGLKDFFGVPTRWKESRGVNTAQEGLLATEILKQSGVTKIYLVTHALHMPRALYAFQSRGISIIPAPTGYVLIASHLGKFSKCLPSIDALRASSAALREYIGIFWYHIHYTS